MALRPRRRWSRRLFWAVWNIRRNNKKRANTDNRLFIDGVLLTVDGEALTI